MAENLQNEAVDVMNPGKEDPSMALKLQLMGYLKEIIVEKGWNQTWAAKELGISRSRLCRLLGGDLKNVSEGRLVECLTTLGRDVQIFIGPEHRGTGTVLVLKLPEFKRF